MKLKYIFGITIIFIFSIFLLYIISYNNTYINNKNQTNITNNLSNVVYNNTNNNLSNITNQFYIPPNDYVINKINWSKYPNLQKGYILAVNIVGPNDILNYEFIDVQICTEIKNTDNKTLINEQLIDIAKEVKNIYGPISSITIAGTRGGAAQYFIEILPYNDTIYIF